MTDLLDMNLINSLPQPLYVSENGKDWWWPVQDICVESGIIRIDVCGMLQVSHISEYRYLRDDTNIIIETDDLYMQHFE